MRALEMKVMDKNGRLHVVKLVYDGSRYIVYIDRTPFHVTTDVSDAYFVFKQAVKFVTNMG